MIAAPTVYIIRAPSACSITVAREHCSSESISSFDGRKGPEPYAKLGGPNRVKYEFGLRLVQCHFRTLSLFISSIIKLRSNERSPLNTPITMSTTTTQTPTVNADNVIRMFPDVNTQIARSNQLAFNNNNDLEGYDEEQIRLMDEVCIVLDENDKPIGSASKKVCTCWESAVTLPQSLVAHQ